jgi:hypothetical protein
LASLKLYIEYSRDTVANFLRGLYDSDGGHYKYKKYSRIHRSNSNKDLLWYVQYLLRKYFDINATGPYQNKIAGRAFMKSNKEVVKTNHDNYQIDIYRELHVQRPLSKIGFSITEKQLGLKRRRTCLQTSPLFISSLFSCIIVYCKK